MAASQDVELMLETTAAALRRSTERDDTDMQLLDRMTTLQADTLRGLVAKARGVAWACGDRPIAPADAEGGTSDEQLAFSIVRDLVAIGAAIDQDAAEAAGEAPADVTIEAAAPPAGKTWGDMECAVLEVKSCAYLLDLAVSAITEARLPAGDDGWSVSGLSAARFHLNDAVEDLMQAYYPTTV